MSWGLLWTVVFFSAFVAFTWVSLLIAVRGIGEIRDLVSRLEKGGGGPPGGAGEP